MLATLRLAPILVLALSLAAPAYAAVPSHQSTSSAQTAKHKPKRSKKSHVKPVKVRSAAKANPNMRASHKKVIKHARTAPKKKAAPAQSGSPTVGTKI
jgi:hypothetical protein